MTRILAVGSLLFWSATGARADWREQNGVMWANLSEQARVAYIQGFHAAAEMTEANCHLKVLNIQVADNPTQEQTTVLHSVCDVPKHASGTDEEIVGSVNEFYRNPDNERITVAHVLDILARKSRGELDGLDMITILYRISDKIELH